MKNLSYILVTLLCLSCSREEALPVSVDFDIDVFNDDFSIPVQVVIINKTKGAEIYQWVFEGAIPATSNDRNPGVIRYEEKGEYTITLYATNEDGSEGEKEIVINIDDPVIIDFSATPQVDNFSPVSVVIENSTTGASEFLWAFEGGNPSLSTQQHPGTIVFSTPGEHTISLQASNGLETDVLEKTITVAPYLEAYFEIDIAFEDDDYQAPVSVKLVNNSVSATSYNWSFTGANIASSSAEEPEIVFNSVGTQTITLTATNGKETKTISKNINILENTNLRIYEDIQLGINSAHTSNSIGAFFSTLTREVYSAAEVNEEVSSSIDIVFFGLNENFSRNRFVSPDGLRDTTFPEIEGAQHTKFINSQELCNCSASLSVADFDAMNNDTILQNLTIEETAEGLQDFNSDVIPRIVLFETQDGRKGAIKIKDYVSDGTNSYIVIDIKIQKENK